MVQDMVDRIRNAERQGEEMERQAIVKANARLAQVAEEIASLRRLAEEGATEQDRAAEEKTAAECVRIREQAEREAREACDALSAQAEKNRQRAVAAAVTLLSE